MISLRRRAERHADHVFLCRMGEQHLDPDQSRTHSPRNVKTQTNAASEVTIFAYDLLGRLLQRVEPGFVPHLDLRHRLQGHHAGARRGCRCSPTARVVGFAPRLPCHDGSSRLPSGHSPGKSRGSATSSEGSDLSADSRILREIRSLRMQIDRMRSWLKALVVLVALVAGFPAAAWAHAGHEHGAQPSCRRCTCPVDPVKQATGSRHPLKLDHLTLHGFDASAYRLRRDSGLRMQPRALAAVSWTCVGLSWTPHLPMSPLNL